MSADVQVNGQSVVTTSATSAPAAGTVETWTVTATASTLPALLTNQTYALVDATSTATTTQQAEKVRITAYAGPGSTSITVTRGVDGTTPVAHANPAQFNIIAVSSFLNQSKSGAPVWNDAPERLINKADPRTSGYNFNGRTMHPTRAALAKTANNIAPCDIVFAGDSTLVGYDDTSFVYSGSIPRQFGSALASLLGIPTMFTGGIQQGVVDATHAGDRWTLTGGWVASTNFLSSGTTTGTATWASIDAGDTIEFFISNLSTTGMTWTIDGVAQTPITTTGANSLQKVTVSAGVGLATHTVVFNGAAAKSFFIFGIWTYKAGTNQLRVHNLAIGGSRANSGTNGQNWNSVATTAPTGLGYTAPLTLTTAGITTPALVVVCLANNDAFQSVAAATALTGLINLRGYWPSSPFIFMHPPMVPATNAALFTQYSNMFYDQIADALDVAYFDWNDFVNTSASFIADGNAGASNTHPTFAHQKAVGQHLANLVAA